MYFNLSKNKYEEKLNELVEKSEKEQNVNTYQVDLKNEHPKAVINLALMLMNNLC